MDAAERDGDKKKDPNRFAKPPSLTNQEMALLPAFVSRLKLLPQFANDVDAVEIGRMCSILEDWMVHGGKVGDGNLRRSDEFRKLADGIRPAVQRLRSKMPSYANDVLHFLNCLPHTISGRPKEVVEPIAP